MPDPSNPMAAAQRHARQELPRRFYKDVTVGLGDGGFQVLLDGRAAKTPARQSLQVGTRALADVVAAEWSAQDALIDPASMPLTRLVNAALDRVARDMPAVRDDIAKYGRSDLIAYRAETPPGLAAAQEKAWSPLVTWARYALGARLRITTGLVHVEQDADLTEALAALLEPLDAMNLAAVHMVTALTGSAIIALSFERAWLKPDQAWAAAHVDEDWQIAHWGADALAVAARAARRRDFDAAALVLGG